jgi:hypothetical protein
MEWMHSLNHRLVLGVGGGLIITDTQIATVRSLAALRRLGMTG